MGKEKRERWPLKGGGGGEGDIWVRFGKHSKHEHVVFIRSILTSVTCKWVDLTKTRMTGYALSYRVIKTQNFNDSA